MQQQLGSILCTKNREPAYASAFSANRSQSTTVFLSSFWFIFLLSFSKEGRKTNVEKEFIKFNSNIRLNQLYTKTITSINPPSINDYSPKNSFPHILNTEALRQSLTLAKPSAVYRKGIFYLWIIWVLRILTKAAPTTAT